MTDSSACTNACTSMPENRHGVGSGTVSQPTDPKCPGDFAAALAMIATLPLSEAEKAGAVRRLLSAAHR